MFPSDTVISVRELNSAAKRLIEGGLPLVWVRGEISNFVAAASGHWYFSLKDEQAQVRCVMFRHKHQYLDFRPANGMQVEVHALATLYEARGDFQLTLERMRPAGQGALYEAFERLKQQLAAEGLFEAARKRPLPRFPRCVGVVTSPQAAALRDVLRTLNNRMPGIPVVLYPTMVQGEGAARRIAQAIRVANERAECDVLLICRGGGSIEDLWAFNEEVVARAIAASAIPTISGVGHETDFTIADFVADLRAATPTAAAQAAVPDRQELRQALVKQARQLNALQMHQIERRMQQVDFLQRRLVHPAQRLQQQREQLSGLARRLRQAQGSMAQRQVWAMQSIRQRWQVRRPDIEVLRVSGQTLQHRLQLAIDNRLTQADERLRSLQLHLHLLDPQQVLARGYSLVRKLDGGIVRSATELHIGEALEVTFSHGSAQVAVSKVREGRGESG